MHQYDVRGPSFFEYADVEPVSESNVSRSHTNGLFRRNFADRRYKGDLAQYSAGDDACPSRRVCAYEHAMIDTPGRNGTDQTQSQAVVAGATDLDKIFSLVGDANHLRFRH